MIWSQFSTRAADLELSVPCSDASCSVARAGVRRPSQCRVYCIVIFAASGVQRFSSACLPGLGGANWRRAATEAAAFRAKCAMSYCVMFFGMEFEDLASACLPGQRGFEKQSLCNPERSVNWNGSVSRLGCCVVLHRDLCSVRSSETQLIGRGTRAPPLPLWREGHPRPFSFRYPLRTSLSASSVSSVSLHPVDDGGG